MFVIFFVAWGSGAVWERYVFFPVICDDTFMALVASVSGAAAGCTTLTIGLLEVTAVIMLAKRMLRKGEEKLRKEEERIREEARAEVLAEVQAEAQASIQAETAKRASIEAENSRLWEFINRVGLQAPPDVTSPETREEHPGK